MPTYRYPEVGEDSMTICSDCGCAVFDQDVHTRHCARSIAAIRVAVAERFLGEGDEDLGPAMTELQTPREESAERTAVAAQAFLRSAQAPGSAQKEITVEIREAVEEWEQER